MASFIELIAKIKPKNNGKYPLVDDVDVEMEDGSRLSEAIKKPRIPDGGTEGQILAKKSNKNGDAEWVEPLKTEDIDKKLESKLDKNLGAENSDKILITDAEGNIITQNKEDFEGGGGTTNYNDLENKPQINGVELIGNKTNIDLKIANPTQEQVSEAVNNYLRENPVSGMTQEQITQLNKNTEDISELSDETVKKIISVNMFDRDSVVNGILDGSSMTGMLNDWKNYKTTKIIEFETKINNKLTFNHLPYTVQFGLDGTPSAVYSSFSDNGDGTYYISCPANTNQARVTLHVVDYENWYDDFMFVINDNDLPSEFEKYGNVFLAHNERIAKYIDVKVVEEIVKKILTSVIVEGEKTIIGIGACENALNIKDIVAIGNSALQNIDQSANDDNGRYNTAIGVRAMQSSTTADHCTAIGFQSMQFNTTGNANTVVGEDALYENLTGGGNTVIGAHGMQNTNSTNNTAIGNSVALYHKIGDTNVIIGANTLMKIFGLGVNVTKLSNSIIIGCYAGANLDKLSNVIVLGRSTIADKSNQMKLGNSAIKETIIYGDDVIFEKSNDGGNKKRKLKFNDDGSVTWEEV